MTILGLCHKGPETRWLQADKSFLTVLEVRVQNPDVSMTVLVVLAGGSCFLLPAYPRIPHLEGGAISLQPSWPEST